MSVPLVSVFDLDDDERLRLFADADLVPASAAPSRLRRVELRLGLWLLLRAARHQSAARSRSHRQAFAADLARAHREHAAWRELALGTVRV
ncbi:hypothetical protein QSU92_00700 [Microbacterium sp. ET2]|uniref:hypothetical protein n=1 Tax=Microbacterium albipurpureum TaxID=3050384 RepID=UPI00259C91B4|nr:hypothetical protein [Microbacterium sp. ET2 (Ac-2212)]WJL95784.1 hypothetical protein QSU92_00700 [Microbacterium sp. ET2 (Ac-2212)]